MVTFIPTSALLGDNVTVCSAKMGWYLGKTLLDYLETISTHKQLDHSQARFPVQTIITEDTSKKDYFKGYAGKLSGGVLKKGDNITIMPSGKSSTVKSILAPSGEIIEAFPTQSLCISLSDNLDISRGDIIVASKNPPEMLKEFEAMICWFQREESQLEKKYRILHCNSNHLAKINEVIYKIDINTAQKKYDGSSLFMNDIGRVKIISTNPILLESYTVNKRLGSVVLVDIKTNETVAAGMIV